jgi:hypothetical protein
MKYKYILICLTEVRNNGITTKILPVLVQNAFSWVWGGGRDGECALKA